MSDMLRVHSIETLGTRDGPGLRLVVFLQGCQFRCLYCHNPDTQDMKGQARGMKPEEIVAQLEKIRPYIESSEAGGGLTVSGGEPLLQAAEVEKLFRLAHEVGFQTALDTNGGIFNDEVKQLLAATDLVLLDVKHIKDKNHQKLTGKSNKTTLKLAEWREKSGQAMWLRYVLVPGINDDDEALKAWGEHFAKYKTIQKVEILPYHRLGVEKYAALGRKYELEEVREPDKKILAQAERILREEFPEEVLVEIR